ncbi:LysR family transcriptional regulator [Vibrio sinaloensis]|uniref:LysR family transcriptional regulator n=1 Tax=Photobacterium sp. (strain ATCC 43367) TaxID=379097 RepID=UPI00205FECB9|nr:LysR family transcriptional regulator [Vibrio sinaloensis]UPQ88487.1 LysR family transcriptional regulator [Vibrio sinaloensis]
MLLEGIETLLVLSKAKTMSRTGSLLYISQSAVSKRIANLESKLGKKLIVPDGRNVQLTQDAIKLINSIGPAFNELQGLINDQQTMADQSLLRLDCSETLVAGYLSAIIGRHFQQDPYLTLTTNHTPRIVENVQSGKAHIGVCAGHMPKQSHLMQFHLLDEPFSIVFRHQLEALPTTIITNDLNNPANSYQLEILTRLNITPIMEMDSYSAAAQLAIEGIAPALVPISVIKAMKIEPKYCSHFEQLTPLYRPIHICCRGSSYQNPRIKSVITAIADAVPKAASVPLA